MDGTWIPTRADLLEVARQVDEVRGVPSLSAEEAVEDMFRARDRRGMADEPEFMRTWFVRLERLRRSWEAGGGPVSTRAETSRRGLLAGPRRRNRRSRSVDKVTHVQRKRASSWGSVLPRDLGSGRAAEVAGGAT